jgi:hypothetical protein
MDRVLLSQSLDASVPTRLFRAGSPSDVVCAALVADRLPEGNNVLAIAREKSQADSDSYRDCFTSLMPLYDWRGVVDLSGWSLAQDRLSAPTLTNRLRRLRDVRRSMNQLRRWIAPVLGIAPADRRLAIRVDGAVDEIFLTCPNHYDVRSLCRVFPLARKIFYPHTFDSLAPAEVDHYEPFCAAATVHLLDRASDLLKRMALGRDAVPMRHLAFDMVYTFREVPAWGSAHTILDFSLTPVAMRKLFDRLPDRVRTYFEELAHRGEGEVGVLLLNSDDFGKEHPYDREIEAYVYLASELCRRGVRSIIAKPHSRSGAAWNARVEAELRKALPGLNIQFIARYTSYPIEITIAPFQATRCAGMGTTCLRTLPLIYGMTAYCAEKLMLEINAWNTAWRENYRIWVEDYGKEYIAV